MVNNFNLPFITAYLSAVCLVGLFVLLFLWRTVSLCLFGVAVRDQYTVFEFPVPTENNDNIFNLYSLSLSMKSMFLNANVVLHYLQLCVLLEVWLLTLSRKYFWIFNNKTRLRLNEMNPQSFKSAVIENSKLVY